MRSRLAPMKQVAKMLRVHQGLLLYWFKAKKQIALGAEEGLKNEVKVTTKKAYAFKRLNEVKVVLYQTLGNLPKPETTHRFCG